MGSFNHILYNINHLSAKFIKWSNTLKQIVGKLATICLSVFDHFSGLAFKGLNPDPSYSFQNDLKNIPNKVTSTMKATCKQYLQKKAYRLV